MKQETKNEIDLLLRRLSRREGTPASDTGSRVDSDHLDADELSSYAENVLPAAARARYTEHLAECSRCRELVVQLSASVPVVAATESATATGPSGLRKFLASLFSPMVLRYAVPALGLIIVAAIGIAVLRSREQNTFVAQLERAPQSPPAASPSEDPNKGFIHDSQKQVASQSPAATPQLQAKTAKEEERPAAPGPPNAPPVVTVHAEPKPDQSPQKTEQQPVANEAPPAPKPTDEITVQVQGNKPPPEQTRAEPATTAAKTDSNFQKGRAEDKNAEEAAAARPAAKMRRSDSKVLNDGQTLGVASGAKDRDEGTTHTVAGRRFRKQGGVWVDSAYDSGSRILNVARGSEQYRALVADEPEIKRIADQLDGTIIVVWKGRTYRIH